MEQTDMTMTRTQYEHTCAVKAGIIHALRDNLGDEFSAKEIAASMAWPSDLEPMQVGAILKSMVAEGLVTRRRQHDGNLYQLHKRALAWTPPEYDWRVARSNPVAKTKAQVARLTAQLSELTKKNDCFRWANANLTTQLSDAQSKLADAMADLATSQREQDRLHQRLREQELQRAEDQNRIDAMMDVARPHLAKGKHGDTARAAAPFGLPVIPKGWIGLLKLTLLDDNAKLVLKIDNEGGGAYATLKVDAALNKGEADFIPGLTNGLIGLLDYLLPHLAISPPDHFADTGNMVMTSEARP